MKRTYIAVAVLIIGLAGIAWALVPPPPANQNIGLKDTRFDKLGSSTEFPDQGLCRACHSSGVNDRHHNLVASGVINPVTGSAYVCMNCHPVVTVNGSTGPLYDKECLDCHSGRNFSTVNPLAVDAKVNITRPHHIKPAEAAARNCKFCHGGFIANYDDGHYIPPYNTSLITPTTHYKPDFAS